MATERKRAYDRERQRALRAGSTPAQAAIIGRAASAQVADGWVPARTERPTRAATATDAPRAPRRPSTPEKRAYDRARQRALRAGADKGTAARAGRVAREVAKSTAAPPPSGPVYSSIVLEGGDGYWGDASDGHPLHHLVHQDGHAVLGGNYLVSANPDRWYGLIVDDNGRVRGQTALAMTQDDAEGNAIELADMPAYNSDGEITFIILIPVLYVGKS